MNTVNQNTAASATTLEISPEDALWHSLRSLPRAAWVLFLGVFLNRFGTFVIPFLALYMKEKGYGLAGASIAIGSYGAGTLFACIYGGYLADHIGRRKTIAISMLGGAIAMLALSFADSWWTIVLFTGLNGLFGELYRPASSALLTDPVPNGQRVIAFSAYRIALNAGWAFGPATAGFLATHSFSWLFLGDALSSLLFGIVAWFALPHGIRSATHESGWSIALRNMKKDPAFVRFLVASLLIAMVFFQLSSTYGLFLSHLGYSPAVYGALISFNGVIIVCFELLISNVTRRFDPRYSIALGYLLVGLGSGVNAFVTHIPWLVVAMLILTLGEMISLPVAAAYIADLAPETMRGRYMGVNGLTWGVGLIIGPGLGMFLFSQHAELLWIACAVAGMVSAAIVVGQRLRPQIPTG